MHRRRSARWPRRQRILILAVSPLFAASVVATQASGNVIVRNIKPGPGSSSAPAPMTASSAADDSLVAYPFIPPINGFQPFVVMGLTDENDNEFYSPKAAEPGSLFRPPPNQTQLMSPQPFNAVPGYIVGTLDSGGQATILSYNDSQTVNLFANGLEGVYTIPVGGAGGEEDLDVSDALGQYITGLGNATAGPGGPVVPQSSLKGIWNNSILTNPNEDSVLPTLVGNPIFAHWQVVMRNSQVQRLHVNGRTFQGPQIELRNVDTAHDNTFVRVAMSAKSAGGANSFPVFIPDFFGSDQWQDNPESPTIWNFMGVEVNLANNPHGTNHALTREFLFDTGAQVSVISTETANNLGINTGGGNPDPPDFTAEVLGVGGITIVNGYYLDNLSLVTDGVDLEATNVPVLVLDLQDPLDGAGAVPGILGMNLLNDRDVIVNAKPNVDVNAVGYLAFSEFALPQPKWNANSGGDWGDNSKWFRGVPWQPGEVANFTATTTAPQTINVDTNNGQGPYAMGRINFDNPNRYTISGPGSLRMEELVGNAVIQVNNGSHTINVPMQLASSTTMTVIPAASVLTLGGDIASPNGSGIVKTGQGTVEARRLENLGDVDIQAGKIKMLVASTGGAAERTSSIDTLTIAAAARLDLTNNNLVIREGTAGTFTGGAYGGVQGDVARAYHNGAWDQPGLMTSEPNAQPAVGTHTIGVATASQVLFIAPTATGTFAGQSATGTSVIAMYTYAGDLNLDGRVDAQDYGIIDNFVQFPGSDGYANGDINYDGVIDAADYGIIDNTIQLQGAPIPTTAAAAAGGAADFASVTAVPEPAACGFAIVTAAALLARRRRRALR
jgi:hypothetical protein